MDWRTSDEQPDLEIHSRRGLARDAGGRPLARVPVDARHGHGVASLDASLRRALRLARTSGARFGAEDLSE
jgi:hypothetical protein